MLFDACFIVRSLGFFPLSAIGIGSTTRHMAHCLGLRDRLDIMKKAVELSK